MPFRRIGILAILFTQMIVSKEIDDLNRLWSKIKHKARTLFYVLPLLKIWETEQIPEEWKKGYLRRFPFTKKFWKFPTVLSIRRRSKGIRQCGSRRQLKAHVTLRPPPPPPPPPSKFISIIRQLYNNSSCQVVHDGKLTNTFQVQTGVRQGCLLSPTIFLLVVDWIMKRASSGKKTGIQWIFTKQLEDLDFADDISLLSHRHQDAQEVLSRLAEAEKTGLNINTKKTDVIRIKNKKQDPITLHDEDLNEDEKFVYLGSVINKDGGQTKTSRDGSTTPDMYSTPSPPPPHLELLTPLPPQQDRNLQHQRQVCPAVWLRNMA